MTMFSYKNIGGFPENNQTMIKYKNVICLSYNSTITVINCNCYKLLTYNLIISWIVVHVPAHNTSASV